MPKTAYSDKMCRIAINTHLGSEVAAHLYVKIDGYVLTSRGIHKAFTRPDVSALSITHVLS